MIVWVDADACPVQIKEILFRAAERVRVRTVLVANHALRVPRSEFIEARQVESGFDVADARILAGLGAVLAGSTTGSVPERAVED